MLNTVITIIIINNVRFKHNTVTIIIFLSDRFRVEATQNSKSYQ